MAETSKSGIFERFVPMLVLITVVLAFVVGVLWQKVDNLSGTSGTGTTNNNPNNPPAANPPADINGKLTDDQAKNVPGVLESDHLRGSKNADLVMIEYSDLECPFCEKFHPTAKKAMDEYGNKIAWVYRQFPLETIHPRALPAALASECVAKLGGNDGFWKFIDKVFGDQAKYLTDDGLKLAATESGANGDSFSSCVAAKEFEGKIREIITSATSAGVTGTPATFVVNKKGQVWLVPGAVPYESLKATLDEALKS